MKDTEPTGLEAKWAEEIEDADNAVEEAAEAADPVAELQAEVAQLKDQLLRGQAEMINFRRRTDRDRLERIAAARAGVVRELLPAIDNLDRAIGADTDNLDAYRQGVDLILRSLHEALAHIGVERIDPQGEAFDPHLHEAVDQVADADVAAGHVASVYKSGYQLGDRLLRAAAVAVSTGAGDKPETEE